MLIFLIFFRHNNLHFSEKSSIILYYLDMATWDMSQKCLFLHYILRIWMYFIPCYIIPFLQLSWYGNNKEIAWNVYLKHLEIKSFFMGAFEMYEQTFMAIFQVACLKQKQKNATVLSSLKPCRQKFEWYWACGQMWIADTTQTGCKYQGIL